MKAFLAGLVTYGVLDYLFLGSIARGFYRAELGPIARLTPDGSPTLLWAAAIPVYLLVIGGLMVFVLPRTTGASAIETLAWGGLFGLVAYGVYDFTNLATLRQYSLRLALVDTAWGAIVCGVATLMMKLTKSV